MPSWLIVICATIVLFYLYLQRKFTYWSSQGIPGNSTLSDLVRGLYQIFKKPLFEIQVENYEKFGRIFGTFEGFKPVLFVGEPNLLKNILVKDFYAFHNRTKFDIGEPIFEQLLLFSRDDQWKKIRSIMSPTFTSGKMRKMSSLVKECSDNFIKNCKVMAGKNEEFDCKPYMGAYALDVVASTAFGTKLNSMAEPNSEFVTKVRSITSRDNPFFFITIVFFQFVFRWAGRSFVRGLMNYFRDLSLHIIGERQKENVKGCDFLQLMMDAQEGVLEVTAEDAAEISEEKQSQVSPRHKTLTKEEMLSQCVLFLLVGNETTSNTMSLMSYNLALNQDCQDRLLQEIDDACKKHEGMNFDVVNKLPYLDAVINETLRLHPIVFGLLRECTEDYTLEGTGVTIKKGCEVHIPVYCMHRDPKFFSEPEKFNPDRFLPENRHLIPQYAYMPFGEGPRNCIGMRFALMTIKLAMVQLLREIRIVATEETKRPLEFYRGQRISLPKAIVVKMEERKK